MNILLVSINDWAGYAYALMRAINGCTTHKARSISHNDSWIRYPKDIFKPSEDDTREWIEWSDVLCVFDDGHGVIPKDTPYRPTIIVYHGTWYRNHHKELNVRHYKYVQLCTTLDLTLLGPKWLPAAVPDRSYLLNPPDVFTVSHSPTHKDKKGTKIIETAVGGLDGVRLEITSGVPNDECIRRKAHSHLFVDQIGPMALGYGTSALEAWSLGLPVISDASKEIRKVIRRQVGYLPFCSAGEELRKIVGMMASNERLRQSWASAGREYWREFHSERAVSGRFVEICKELL